MISLERKRAERSHNYFLLVLLDAGGSTSSQESGHALAKILSALSAATRETDITGWYKQESMVGVLLTEIATGERSSIVSTILTRISVSLESHLTFEQFRQINISFHLFPEDWKQDIQRPSNPALYPDLTNPDNSKSTYRLVKRGMDIAGSLLMLILCVPIFALAALAIKLTSKGPVFFRQQRIGQYGIPFAMLKFRSMHINNDANTHKTYVTQLIAGKAVPHPSNGNGTGVYKITNDSRITAVGAWLRRASLDELPQIINVLKGEMSLVGPRPPVPYEVDVYDLWHRRRLLEAKPGITGLWQVSGRNRVKFDDMVRLDLAYARTWSPWVDLQILMRTPRAIIEGAH